MNTLTGEILTLPKMSGNVGAKTINIGTADYEVYEGSYKVTPAVSSQTLDTSNKLMQADVLVEKIPYAEVSNNSGGKTASIG